jgi:hypothetical protein
VTAWVEESTAEEEPRSTTPIEMLSGRDGVGLIVPEMV